MSDLMNELKEKNSQSINRLTKKFYYIVFSMWFIGALIILINPDQLITFGVLMIFFGFIFFMITLFLSALNASKTIQNQIKNSVELVYQNYIQHFNKTHATEFEVQSKVDEIDPWFLVPSFANKGIYYCIKDQKKQLSLYYGEAYNVAGSKQTRSYYFKGLYIILDGLDNLEEMQYRDHAPLHQKIIAKFTPLIQEDQHKTSRFEYKKELDTGIFYSIKETDMPDLFKSLIRVIKSKPYVDTVKMAIQNNQLHIAIEQNDSRLPYIKKYKEEELDLIEKTVKENANLLLEIEQQVNQYI